MDDLNHRFRRDFRISREEQIIDLEDDDGYFSPTDYDAGNQPPPAGYLCAMCEDSMSERPPALKQNEARYDVWKKSYRELRRDADDGCVICEEVCDYIQNPSPLMNPRNDSLLHLTREERQNLEVECMLVWNGSYFYLLRYDIFNSRRGVLCDSLKYLLVEENAVRCLQRPRLRIEEGARCECCMSKLDRLAVGFEYYTAAIKHWLNTCLEGHANCEPHDQKFLPNRLIDIGSGSSPSGIRLVTKRDPSWRSGEPYATLSHRWREIERIPILTMTNIAEFKDFIPLEILPSTFREAIHVARKLGVRFIWIDSLCIIQDSKDDWKHESSLMGKIYECCYVNLSAITARDGLFGTFAHAKYDETEFLQRRIKSEWNIEFNGTSAYILPRWSLFFSISYAPLNSRGWVLQERALAPRTLHFGDNALHWECCQCTTSNFLSQAGIVTLHWPQVTNNLIVTGLRNAKMWKHTTNTTYKAFITGKSSMRQLYEPWAAIVARYSTTALTEERDQLVALSGLAKVFRSIIKDEYFAGMWRRTIMYDLMWRVLDSSSASRQLQYRAPSWSWASINASPRGIETRDPPEFPHQTQHIVDIIDVQAEPLEEDNTGQLKSGFIKFRGLLLSDSFLTNNEAQDSRPGAWRSEGWISQIKLRFDLYEDEVKHSRFNYLPCLMHTTKKPSRLCGLILRSLHADRNEFVRVGYFSFRLSSLSACYKAMNDEANAEAGGYRVITVF
jgi:heterokaryon incompatibility protein (HET)